MSTLWRCVLKTRATHAVVREHVLVIPANAIFAYLQFVADIVNIEWLGKRTNIFYYDLADEASATLLGGD